jgi:hypothetical protein
VLWLFERSVGSRLRALAGCPVGPGLPDPVTGGPELRVRIRVGVQRPGPAVRRRLFAIFLCSSLGRAVVVAFCPLMLIIAVVSECLRHRW